MALEAQAKAQCTAAWQEANSFAAQMAKMLK